MKSKLAYLLAVLLIAPLQAAPQLKFAVIVTRHGVRSPTWEQSRLNQYSAQPWPDFGVPPGNLTPRGALLIKLMGAYYHDWFVSEKLFSPQGCSDVARIQIWADTDQRTLETGRALGASLLPGCTIPTASRPTDEADPLFSGSDTPDPALAVQAIQARITPELLAQHREALETLQRILGDAPKKLLQPLIPVSVSINGDAAQLNGPFNIGSTLGEDLLLEYGNGFAGNQLGWGRLTEANLLKVLEIHTVYADLMRRTPYLARTRGANLLNRIQTALTGAASPDSHSALLVLSGHDTNLSNLSGMLSLSWQLPSYQPDDTPPGGALIFSLWRSDSGTYFVRTRYAAQTMSQMHNATPGAPAMADLTIPGCSPDCPLAKFQQLASQAASKTQ